MNEILQNKITGTQTSFSTNIGSKTEFHPPLSFFLSCYDICFHCSYLPVTITITTLETSCIKCWVAAFHTWDLIKISLLCGYHWMKEGNRRWKRGWLYIDNFNRLQVLILRLFDKYLWIFFILVAKPFENY
jgi:hypothetical protein